MPGYPFARSTLAVYFSRSFSMRATVVNEFGDNGDYHENDKEPHTSTDFRGLAIVYINVQAYIIVCLLSASCTHNRKKGL